MQLFHYIFESCELCVQTSCFKSCRSAVNGSSSSYYDAMTDDIEPPQKTKTNSQYSNLHDSTESTDLF